MDGMHLMVGTPCYGGMMTTEYCQSLLGLQMAMTQHGHHVTPVFLGNESLIQRGRNTISHIFTQSNCSHLLFCDADIKFRPNDVARMIKADKGIIIGPVPMKGFNWERIRRGALRMHKDLSKLSGVFALNELAGHGMTQPRRAVPDQAWRHRLHADSPRCLRDAGAKGGLLHQRWFLDPAG
jgi:hypothetical protein